MLFTSQSGAEDDSMICQDVAILGPLMVKQYGKLKVSTQV